MKGMHLRAVDRDLGREVQVVVGIVVAGNEVDFVEQGDSMGHNGADLRHELGRVRVAVNDIAQAHARRGPTIGGNLECLQGPVEAGAPGRPKWRSEKTKMLAGMCGLSIVLPRRRGYVQLRLFPQGCGVDMFGSGSRELGELWTPCATMEAS